VVVRGRGGVAAGARDVSDDTLGGGFGDWDDCCCMYRAARARCSTAESLTGGGVVGAWARDVDKVSDAWDAAGAFLDTSDGGALRFVEVVADATGVRRLFFGGDWRTSSSLSAAEVSGRVCDTCAAAHSRAACF
jgi:hypothetical protein